MENLISQIETFLSNKDNVRFGYIFGSYAKGLQTSKSDVDVALYLKEHSFDHILEISYELSKLIKKEVDVTVLNTVKDIYLLDEILKDGIVIKNNADREDFELKKQHDILDYKAFRKMIDAA